MNFSNLRIRSKIGLGFAAIVAMVVLLGGMALSQLSSVNDSTAQIATNNLPSVTLAGRIGHLVQSIRRAEARHVMSRDPNEKADQEKRMAQAREELLKLDTTAQDIFDSPEEIKAFNDFRQHRDAWLAFWDQKLSALSRTGEASAAEAAKLYRDDSSLLFTAALADVQALSDINGKLAEQAWAQAQATYARAKWLVIACVLTAAVLALALATVIARVISHPIEMAAAAASAIAEGNMTHKLQADGQDETAKLLRALEAMRNSLVTVVSNVRQGSESVAQASSEIAQGNSDLSTRTEQQASALQETAASMEELGATVKQNAAAASQANQLAMNASDVAVQGGSVVAQVVDTMKDINDSSKKISDIITVIDGIAFQTNILALNAAVEAARAGEQGRGFAVVASEVRSLAQRSADAAKEIKSLISASVERVERGTALVDQAGQTMGEVVGAIKRVTDIVGEISAASAEQSSGVSQVGEAVTHMDRATQQNAALVEQSAAAAESLKVQAQQLVASVSIFRIDR